MPSPPLAYIEPESGRKGQDKVRSKKEVQKRLEEHNPTRLFQDLYRLKAVDSFFQQTIKFKQLAQTRKKHKHQQRIAFLTVFRYACKNQHLKQFLKINFTGKKVHFSFSSMKIIQDSFFLILLKLSIKKWPIEVFYYTFCLWEFAYNFTDNLEYELRVACEAEQIKIKKEIEKMKKKV